MTTKPAEKLFPYAIYIITSNIFRSTCDILTYHKMENDIFWFISFYVAIPNYPFIAGKTFIDPFMTQSNSTLHLNLSNNRHRASIIQYRMPHKHTTSVVLGPHINRKEMIENNSKYCCELELKNGCIELQILPQNNKQFKIMKSSENLKIMIIQQKMKQNLCGLKKGRKVRLFKGETGTIRFVGNLMKNIMVGMELDEMSDKGSDGKFCGTEYFKVQKGMGLFVRKEDIESILDDKYMSYICGERFILELDLKNWCVVIRDVLKRNDMQWVIYLDNIDDVKKTRISLFLEEIKGNNINLISEWWQKL